MRMTSWHRECSTCGWSGKILCWDYELETKARCPEGHETQPYSYSMGTQAPVVIPDDIPGGIDIRHGLCNADGSPRRYFSKTEIRREAEKRGLTIMGETPNVRREF